MKKFDERYQQICADMPSTDVARTLAGAGFGIVPGTGAWRDGRPVTRKNGESGSHSNPLYEMDVMTDWLMNPGVATQCPFYVALGAFGDRMLTVVDIDNGHGDAEALGFDEMWTAVEDWFDSLGCLDALDTIAVRTPHEGVHLWFSSDIAGLFKWCTGMHDDAIPAGVAVDWLTPTGKQNLTGPGVVREGLRYDLFIPSDADELQLADVVKPLPEPLLRWLVAHHVDSHDGRPERCFTSEIGWKRAQRCETIADLIKPRRVSAPRSQSQTSSSCDEVKLWKHESIASAGTRHNRLIEFAGGLVNRVTGRDFDSTCDIIRREIEAFAAERCNPAYSISDPDVRGAIDAAMTWAAESRDKIEDRIAHRVEVTDADGQTLTQVIRDFGERKINGATYRCKLRRGGQVGLPLCSPTNVIAALEQDAALKGCFGYDQMNARRSILRPLPWDSSDEDYPRFVTDDDMHRLVAYIDEVGCFNPSKDFMSAFATVCARHPFNPMVDFVRSFEGRWDGQEHISHLVSDWLGVDSSEDIIDGQSFSGTCMTIWMRGAIRRALHPGCSFDYLIIFGGAQGIGKTNFIRRLATRPDWLCENLPDIGDEKRCFEAISSSWIACIDELAGMRSQKDVSKVKNYLTRCYDDYRAPYKKEQERIKRHCVFVGTTNELSFLSDRSGARRFMVIQCTGVLTERMTPQFLSEQHRDEFAHEVEQAWAEAYALEMAHPDEALVLPTWAMEHQSETNEEAAVADPVTELAEAFFERHRLLGEPVSYAQIYAYIYRCDMSDYAREKHLKSFQDAVRRVASRHGWKSKRVWGPWGEDGSRIRSRGFEPPALTPDEVAQVEEARVRARDAAKRIEEDEQDFKILFG